MNHKSQVGNTLAIYAAAKGHSDILDLLIQRGVDFSVRGRSNLTPLVAAARDGHSDAVRVLLNADQNRIQPHARALQATRRRGHRSVVEMLVGFISGRGVEQ